jgi:hypothetical protein
MRSATPVTNAIGWRSGTSSASDASSTSDRLNDSAGSYGCAVGSTGVVDGGVPVAVGALRSGGAYGVSVRCSVSGLYWKMMMFGIGTIGIFTNCTIAPLSSLGLRL